MTKLRHFSPGMPGWTEMPRVKNELHLLLSYIQVLTSDTAVFQKLVSYYAWQICSSKFVYLT